MTKQPRSPGRAPAKMHEQSPQDNTLVADQFSATRFRDMQHIEDRQFTSMQEQKTRFPIAEGIGIFVGVVAWDLLSEGYVEITRALSIAAPCSLAWFALRYWKNRKQKK